MGKWGFHGKSLGGKWKMGKLMENVLVTIGKSCDTHGKVVISMGKAMVEKGDLVMEIMVENHWKMVI